MSETKKAKVEDYEELAKRLARDRDGAREVAARLASEKKVLAVELVPLLRRVEALLVRSSDSPAVQFGTRVPEPALMLDLRQAARMSVGYWAPSPRAAEDVRALVAWIDGQPSTAEELAVQAAQQTVREGIRKAEDTLLLSNNYWYQVMCSLLRGSPPHEALPAPGEFADTPPEVLALIELIARSGSIGDGTKKRRPRKNKRRKPQKRSRRR